MDLTYEILNNLSKIYGDTFYLLDTKMFLNNYKEMIGAFRNYYNNTHIAYSYKTNYIPKLCKLINSNGGYAEIVSEIELWLALRIGVKPSDIYYNGPYKKEQYTEKLMLLGGQVNIDSFYEIEIISRIAAKNLDKNFTVGVRCNIDIGQERISRFGFDVASGDLKKAVNKLNRIDNIKVSGLHCHLPFRSLDSFRQRMKAIKRIINDFGDYQWDYISLGGGYIGKIKSEFAKTFPFVPPSFEEYAKAVAGGFTELFKGKMVPPKLILEPGSALVADTMQLITKVIDIKCIKNQYFAIISGSNYNMNPSTKGMNRPIQVFAGRNITKEYNNLVMTGYTCIEDDYLYKDYTGCLGKGDYVVFQNVGSYSVVMKPPFILPDIPIVDISDINHIELVKKGQTPDAVFKDYLV